MASGMMNKVVGAKLDAADVSPTKKMSMPDNNEDKKTSVKPIHRVFHGGGHAPR
jgi:hypothetical protein